MSETKDVRALIEQIDALLAINTSGNAVPRIPGLAVELLTRSRAALEPAPKPAGGEWVTVPREPTEAMCRAGESSEGASSPNEWLDGSYTPENVERIYNTMLAAAPPAPEAPQASEVVRSGLVGARIVIQQLISDEYNVETWGLKQRLLAIDAALATYKRSTTDGQS